MKNAENKVTLQEVIAKGLRDKAPLRLSIAIECTDEKGMEDIHINDCQLKQAVPCRNFYG
jgi:hypothetical protein